MRSLRRIFCIHKYRMRAYPVQNQYGIDEAEIYKFCKRCGKSHHIGNVDIPMSDKQTEIHDKYYALRKRIETLSILEDIILEKGIHNQLNTMYSALAETAARLDPADESDYALRVRQAAGILQ